MDINICMNTFLCVRLCADLRSMLLLDPASIQAMLIYDQAIPLISFLFQKHIMFFLTVAVAVSLH